MTQEQIIEGNKLIAEFMEGKSRDQVQPIVKSHMKRDDIWLPIHGLRSLTELKYHTSWDWLIPVVQKCYKQSDGEEFDKIVDAVSCLDINTLWLAVVEFIKWYKEQK